MLVQKAWDYFSSFVTICSVLYALLPPWEQFTMYPRFQSAYRFAMIFLVRFGSLNLRSTFNPAIAATSNAGGTDTPKNLKDKGENQ
jgi:hypothetical protein